MPIYSVSFYSGSTLSTTQQLYVVPTGYTAVIREMHVLNGDSVSHDFNFQVVEVPGAPQSYIWRQASVPSLGWLQWQGRVALEEHAQILFYPSSSSFWSVFVGGYLLLGVAPNPPP